MRARKNYVGMQFGRLTATEEAEPKVRKDRNTTIRRMMCICECGSVVIVAVPDLKSGNTMSCGCYKVEATKQSNTTHGRSISVSRNGKATSEYHSWRGMIDRCKNERHISYPLYGGRGIKVCDRWRNSFEAFLSDMGEKPSKAHSIDRKDPTGDYTPENCRWATSKEQFANSRVSKEFLEHMGPSRRRMRIGGIWIAAAFNPDDLIDERHLRIAYDRN